MMGREKGARIGAIRKVKKDAYAEALNRLRCDRNLTLLELAARSGVSLRTLKAMESDEGYTWLSSYRGPVSRAQDRTLRAIDRALFGELADTPGHSVMELKRAIDEERRQKVQGRSRSSAPLPRPKGALERDPGALHLKRSPKVQTRSTGRKAGR